MKQMPVLLIFACSLLVARQVGAESWSKQLTHEKTGDDLCSIAVKVDRLKEVDVEEFLLFHVTVTTGTKIKELPHRSGVLRVFNGKEFVASCNVQPTGREGERSFSFRVTANYAAKSTFMYDQHGDFDHISHWFYLKDFIELPLPRGNAPLSELAKTCKGAVVATLMEVGVPELGPPGASNYASKWKVEKTLRGTYPGTVHLTFSVQSIPETGRERPPVVGKSYILITYEANANQVASILDANEKNLRYVQDLLKDHVVPK